MKYAVTVDNVVESPTFSTKKECKEYIKQLRKEHPEFRGREFNITNMPSDDYCSIKGGLSNSLCW